MNRITLLIMALFLSAATYGQEKSLEKFADMDGVKSVYISKALLSLMPGINVEGVNIDKAAGKLENILILSTERKDIRKQLENEILTVKNKGKIEELMRVKDEDDNVNIYMKEIDKGKNEFILVNSDEDELSVIIITGALTLKDIQGIIKEGSE